MGITLKPNETMEDLANRLKTSFDMVHDIAPVAYWYEYLDENGRVTDIRFSDGMRELLGYKSEEDFPNGINTLLTLIHPDDVPTMMENAIGAGTGKLDRYDVVYRIKNADNYYVWCNATGEIIRDCNNTIVGMYGAFIDISQEFELKKKNEQIQESEERHNRNLKIVETLSNDFECINYIEFNNGVEDDVTHIIRTSPTLLNHIPRWNEELNFSNRLKMLESAIIVPEDKEKFKEAMNRSTVLRSIQRSGSYYVRFRALIDGDVRYYQCKFSVADTNNNNISAAVFGIRDVDEETKRELETLHKVEIANKSKTDFLFSMSHDIRTPMNAISGFSKLIRKNIDDKEKVVDSLNKIDQSSDLLLTLINSILDFSRIESGKVIVEEIPGDVRYSFKSIETTMQELAKTKNINLTFEFCNIEDYFVYVDFDRCLRIFVNIISNAIKYTKDGGWCKVRCEQIGKRDDGYGIYQYTFKDNGIGMSEEFQKHVYEHFAREANSTISGIQGSGLGLALCKSFTEIMNGTIECKSTQGVGTTFTVTLPFRLQEGEGQHKYIDPDTDMPRIINKDTDETISFKGKKVLLVEDNLLNLEIAQEILEDEGLIVETAKDGSEAVQILHEKGPDHYDFILMDIQMPIMGGYEATKLIRSMYPDDRIPIIALSANAFQEDKDASIEAGMDAHVAKPISISDLFTTLSKFI